MIVAGASVAVAGCSSSEGGIAPGSGGAAGEDDAATALEGAAGSGGSQGEPDAGGDDDAAPAVEASAVEAGADVTSVTEEPDAGFRASCIFHTPPSVAMDASLPDPPEASVSPSSDAAAEASGMTPDASSDGGRVRDSGTSEGGRTSDAAPVEAGPPVDIGIDTSPFVGPYLTDTAGRALYIYASDTPGDCVQPAVTVCEADCAVSWPIFDAKKRRLAPGLDDSLFGSIQRADGTDHTTYRGWPLYYFKTDTVKGMVTGQGKSKVWWLATVLPPNITIMKTGTEKRLADYAGRTLYTYADDKSNDAGAEPESVCVGQCLVEHPPVLQNRISAVSSLDPNDFSLFARKGTSRLQLAYKGAPLYYAAADARPGQMNGVAPGWSIVAP